MEVIKSYPADLDKRKIYSMMKSPEVQKMSSAADSVLEVDAWIKYSDTNFKTGEVNDVVVVETKDGEMFGTISSTFIREFDSIVEFFGDDVGAIKVVSLMSKSGREFITCTVA